MISVGTDPEVFLTKAGVVTPAGIAFKEVGVPDFERFDTGAIHIDGVSLEFQPDPSYDVFEVVDNVGALLLNADALFGNVGYSINIKPEVDFDLSWCKTSPELTVFGCDPDESAWGDEFSPGSIDASKHPYRYFGAHIHFGTDGDVLPLQDNAAVLSQCLDRTIGLACTVISAGEDDRRNAIYGRPGVYREQPWGMEYRTPSNTILRSPETLAFAFSVGVSTVEMFLKEGYDIFSGIIPDGLVLETMAHGTPEQRREVYNHIAAVFNLPEIPETPGNWMQEWFK